MTEEQRREYNINDGFEFFSEINKAVRTLFDAERNNDIEADKASRGVFGSMRQFVDHMFENDVPIEEVSDRAADRLYINSGLSPCVKCVVECMENGYSEEQAIETLKERYTKDQLMIAKAQTAEYDKFNSIAKITEEVIEASLYDEQSRIKDKYDNELKEDREEETYKTPSTGDQITYNYNDEIKTQSDYEQVALTMMVNTNKASHEKWKILEETMKRIESKQVDISVQHNKDHIEQDR